MATAALRPALEQLASVYAGQLVVAEASTESSVAEQYGVMASPSLLVFRYGNEVLRSVGFLPYGLLRLLCEDALHTDGDAPRFWTPLEECFEEAAMLPLLGAMNLAYERQQRCVNWAGSSQSGRIDIVVYDQQGLVSLVESKRALRSNTDLRQATRQAQNYARAMHSPSFIVAAPAGLWLYALHGAHVLLDGHFSWCELHDSVEPLRERLLTLRG